MTLNPRRIALTFDDGPVDPYTGQILDILARYGAKATFFVIGANVERYPALVRRMIDEGHSVGNHTQNHHRWLAFNPMALAHDIQTCQHTIQHVTGFFPTLFRAPHGMAFGISQFLARQGLTRVGWNPSSHDWRIHSSYDISKRVLRAVKPGSIVLFHDGFPPDKPRDVRATPRDLARIITALQADNYDLVTAPEVLRPPSFAKGGYRGI
ncbi:MAG: polysaccharide deacetylase family protein [Chloroflexi bacterium]|nr:polysaccharide deacetylase family protein [Chloroflexota bacterium]